MLRLPSSDVLFCLGVNLQVSEGAGFGSAFARLSAAGRIIPVSFREIAIYQDVGHDHSADRCVIAVFRRL